MTHKLFQLAGRLHRINKRNTEGAAVINSLHLSAVCILIIYITNLYNKLYIVSNLSYGTHFQDEEWQNSLSIYIFKLYKMNYRNKIIPELLVYFFNHNN